MSARLVALAGIMLTTAGNAAGWKIYTSAPLGYSISYPPDWRIHADYTYDGLGADRRIAGVAFQIPAAKTRRTNLSDTSTQLSVESVSGPGSCNATRFLPDAQDAHEVVDAGHRWSVATAEDAGAGNNYASVVYALLDHSPCLAVRYLIHSTNLENYPRGAVSAFNRTALLADFDEIRHTLVVR